MKQYRVHVEGYFEVEANDKGEAVNKALTLSQDGGQKLREASVPLIGVFVRDEEGDWVLQ